MNPNFPRLLACGVFALAASAGEPTTRLNPFAGQNLGEIRAIAKAESRPAGENLRAAWQLYYELEGSWKPKAAKPKPETVQRLDRLRAKLESLPQPPPFDENVPMKTVGLAHDANDPKFTTQLETPEYQNQKALVLVYLSEHEIDRPQAANRAGRLLTVLAVSHPWDWQVHALFARLLADAGQSAVAWKMVANSLFLNPHPDLDDLGYFAFIGRIAAVNSWQEIQLAMREATPDQNLAEQAIKDSNVMFAPGAEPRNFPIKAP
ncbi:MAG: hypothetical protein JWM32_1081 [Verrucomicrobia bacterium]|nr:hypothetical protein [Verrucomicrobiota bacterium]